MTLREWGLIVVLSVVWGGSFFFNGVAIKELPTFTIVVCRVFLASVILLAIMRARGTKMPTGRRIWGLFLVMALLNNVVPFSLIVWGQGQVAAGVAAILTTTTPLFAIVIAHFFTSDEGMTLGRFVGVAVGLLGVAVKIGGATIQAFGFDLVAQLAILAGALSYASAGVFGRRFRRLGVSPMATATGQITASVFILLPLSLVFDQPWTLPMPAMATIGAIIGLATLSTALAYIVYFRILATAGVTNLLLVTFLIPVTQFFLAWACSTKYSY